MQKSEPPSGYKFASARSIRAANDLSSLCCSSICVIVFYMLATIGLSIYLAIAYAADSNIYRTSISSSSSSSSSSISSNSLKNNLTRKDFLTMKSEDLNRKTGRNFTIPENAIKINEHVYYLGRSTVESQSHLKGFIFLFHAADFNTTTNSSSSSTTSDSSINSASSDAGSTCADFLALGARWKGVPAEKFCVNYYNTYGLSVNYLESTIAASMNIWQSNLNYRIFGANDPNQIADGSDSVNADGKNEIAFQFISNPGVLAATTVWGQFDGAVDQRYLYEADIAFNDAFQWSAGNQPGTYNFQNILVHELGHWCGLGDIYDSQCSQVTMFGRASQGETSKISLDPIDITALKILYGENTNNNGNGNGQNNTNVNGFNPFPSGSGASISSSIDNLIFSAILLGFVLFFV